MKMNLLETILLGSLFFGGLWSLFFLYIKKLIVPTRRMRAKQRRHGTHAYSAVLRKVEIYRQNIEKLAAKSEVGVHSYRLNKVMQSFDAWEAYVYRLVDRLLEFEGNKMMRHEQVILSKKIRNGRYRLAREKDPRLQKEIQETLDSYLRQQAQLDNLRFLMEKTRLDLEEVVSGIGAVYSQLQALVAMDVRSRRTQRLAHGIEEEQSELDDLLAALEELYQ